MIRKTWLLGLACLGLPRLGFGWDFARRGIHLLVAWLGVAHAQLGW